jgi:hypothetical protein
MIRGDTEWLAARQILLDAVWESAAVLNQAWIEQQGVYTFWLRIMEAKFAALNAFDAEWPEEEE